MVFEYLKAFSHSNIPTMTVRIVLLVATLAGALPRPAASQDRGAAQTNYLRAVELDQDAHALEQVLLELLQVRKPFLVASHRQGMARYFAFVMTVSGLNADMAERLDAKGIDLIHAITADTRPFDEQALMADLVIVGDVIEVVETLEPDDGFRSSIMVEVAEVLKGDAPTDTLFIRQRSGLSEDEAPEDTSRDLRPEAGERYLFLLSNGMYRFFVASRDDAVEPMAEPVLAQHFVIYRSYQMDDDRLLWNRYSRRDTRRAFKQIQKLDQLMAAF